MTGRCLQAGLHFADQVNLGDWITTEPRQITPQMIADFAALTGDAFEIHLSDAGAQRHGFAAQVAHGLLVLALVEGMKATATAQLASFAALGWEWTFGAPVLAHDTITARIEIAAKRAAGPGKSLLTLNLSVANQRGQVVQQGQQRVMAYRARPQA
jgi:3-hydroxybutyryl-CoA dehydratase